MLSNIVGTVDGNAATVLCIIFITLCIVAISAIAAIVKYRSKRQLEMQFEIDQQKLRNEDENNKRQSDVKREYEMARLATERDVQFKRIETGLIEGTKVVS